MSVTEFTDDREDIGIIGWQIADEKIPDAVTCRPPISDGPDHDDDPQTRRVDIPDAQVALYRHRLSAADRIRYRLVRPQVWVVSRRHPETGESHEWIYRSHRQADQQWARAIGAEAGFGCPANWCGCHSRSWV